MLKIADNLSLPIDTVTQSLAILAKRRAGKSYAARRFAEQLVFAKQQIVIVDPKGDWWGIRYGRDGKSAGLPVIVLGGEHGDLPLEVNAGELIAKLLVEERVNILLDVSSFRKYEVATFMGGHDRQQGFLESLYRLKAQEQYRTPVMLIVDEADAIAPQKPHPKEERMLGAMEDIVRRGGQRGIGCLSITQRSAVLNKNVLTQTQILIAMRTIAPQDMKAMVDWIDVHGTKEERRLLMESLPALPTGDAWFWSPGWPDERGIFKNVHVLPIETFDSGATPKPGEKRIEPRNPADIDLEALRRQMAATIEKAKAEDPRELRKQIAELKAQLSRMEKTQISSQNSRGQIIDEGKLKKEFERGVAIGADKVRMELKKELRHYQAVVETAAKSAHVAAASAESKLAALLERTAPMLPLENILDVTVQMVKDIAAPLAMAAGAGRSFDTRSMIVAIAPASRKPAAAPPNSAETGDEEKEKFGKMHRAILAALAQHPAGLAKNKLLLHSGYRASGDTSTAFAMLARAGFVEGGAGNNLKITQQGKEWLGDYEVLPVGAGLRAWLLSGNKLNRLEKALLQAICQAYPNQITKGDVLANAGYRASGDASTAFARLRRYGYVTSAGHSLLKAAAELFD